MMRTRTQITASCPSCRSSNSIDLGELLSRASLSIRCRRCQKEVPIALLPGLPCAAKAEPTEPTTPIPASREVVLRPSSGEGPAAKGWFDGALRGLQAVASALLPPLAKSEKR